MKNARTDLTADFVRSILTYEPDTGIFRWKPRYAKCVVAGSIAGRVNGKGYATISIKNSHYQAHRLAWLHYYGEWPTMQIDHINRVRTDNRIANLRCVTGSENCRNRVYTRRGLYGGTTGICWHKKTAKWQAQVCWQGTTIYLGLHKEIEDAERVYWQARKSLEEGTFRT